MNIQHSASNLTVYEIDSDQCVQTVRWEEYLDARNNPERLFMIQLGSHDRDQLGNCLESFGADSLVLERCVDRDAVSGIFVYKRMFTLQLPVAEDWESSRHFKISLLCLSNTLIIISEELLFFQDAFLSNELLFSICRQKDLTGMLFVLLDGLVDHTSEMTLQVRKSVEYMENNLLEDGGDFGKQLLGYRRAIAHFEMALEAKHRTLTALLSAEDLHLDLNRIRDPLRDVVAHVEHSQRYIERIEDRLSELHHHMILMLQEKTNQRLRLLTILSAVFMPLTLVAGIYGMNFRYMPELNWHYGYPLVLIAMLGIAIGLLLFFYKKGWFR